MEYAIVALVVSNIILALVCWRFYIETVGQQDLLDRNQDYQAKLTAEIVKYKENIRIEQSIHKAEVYELQSKLDRIEDIFKPETLHASFDDILARHE